MSSREIVAREEHQIALLERVRDALIEAKSIEDVIELRDQTSAFQTYARKKKINEGSMQTLNELQFRVKRRLGEFTRDLRHEPGKRTDRPVPSGVTGSKKEVLASVGLSEKEANLFERIAAIPEKRFEEEVVKPEATAKALARIGAEYRRDGKAPRRSAPVPVPGPAVSDRILEQRALMFRVAVEKVLRKHLERWPSDASTAPLARVLVEVSHNVKELQS